MLPLRRVSGGEGGVVLQQRRRARGETKTHLTSPALTRG
ncbi:MAG: hypothetical protein QOG78_2993, partial [Rhodospirillaceae bacterium]|nr:hypothetical protein [Rhodospirillaceae bacterium]